MINSITVTGNLGTDPEVKRTAGGKSVCSARLAVSQGRDKPSIWFDLTAWEGAFALKDLSRCRKGMRVTASGRLQMREYNGREYLSIRLDSLAGAPPPGDSRPAASPDPGGDDIPW